MQRHTTLDASDRPATEPQDTAGPVIGTDRSAMKRIPWSEIWRSLHSARMRGQGEMIEVFYDTLFKDAVFDDDGAWSLDRSKRK